MQMNLITAVTAAYMGLMSLLGFHTPPDPGQDLSSETVVVAAAEEKSDFEKAVEIIKKYETLHQPKHWPLVGYGHKVLPGEKFSRTRALSEKEADALLRRDLLKNCAVFRSYGADSLLLGVLAYNIGSGAALRSTVARKLKAGDRDIKENYIAHSRYRGKTHSQIQQRRIEEFDALFIGSGAAKDPVAGPQADSKKITGDSKFIHNPNGLSGGDDSRTRLLSYTGKSLPHGGRPALHTANSMLACTLRSQRYSWR